jgi:hypothetical protein
MVDVNRQSRAGRIDYGACGMQLLCTVGAADTELGTISRLPAYECVSHRDVV